ncbi:GDSL-type esterase/lipase family protein [Corynebacterium sp. H113]|uniref:GDSL-type esterase/lipase family protein n=1 Tax=Corynebacterium sp. H113 TaxID=3133419 RepID=UPI0030AA54C7
MKKTMSRRVAAITAAAATAATTVLTGGIANALPTGNYVAFGDSFPANPGPEDNTTWGSWTGCPQGNTNVSRQVGSKAGLEIRDFTCNGTTAYVPTDPVKSLNAQVDDALARNAINHETQLVTFFVGANDSMQAFWAPGAVQDEGFNAAMTGAIRKIQQRNSHARILVVGYPEFTSRSAADGHYACPINAYGFAPQIPAAPLHQIEMATQARQQRAANETGAGFVNMKDIANINMAMCGRDGERLVSAILDSDTAQYNMTNHLTHRGSAVFSDVIANVYKSTF